jgi:hypothetical protein
MMLVLLGRRHRRRHDRHIGLRNLGGLLGRGLLGLWLDHLLGLLLLFLLLSRRTFGRQHDARLGQSLRLRRRHVEKGVARIAAGRATTHAVLPHTVAAWSISC